MAKKDKATQKVTEEQMSEHFGTTVEEVVNADQNIPLKEVKTTFTDFTMDEETLKSWRNREHGNISRRDIQIALGKMFTLGLVKSDRKNSKGFEHFDMDKGLFLKVVEFNKKRMEQRTIKRNVALDEFREANGTFERYLNNPENANVDFSEALKVRERGYDLIAEIQQNSREDFGKNRELINNASEFLTVAQSLIASNLMERAEGLLEKTPAGSIKDNAEAALADVRGFIDDRPRNAIGVLVKQIKCMTAMGATDEMTGRFDNSPRQRASRYNQKRPRNATQQSH